MRQEVRHQLIELVWAFQRHRCDEPSPVTILSRAPGIPLATSRATQGGLGGPVHRRLSGWAL